MELNKWCESSTRFECKKHLNSHRSVETCNKAENKCQRACIVAKTRKCKICVVEVVMIQAVAILDLLDSCSWVLLNEHVADFLACARSQ